LADLPPGYEEVVAKDGGFRLWELDGAVHVLFIVRPGMFVDFGGFVYRSDDLLPVATPKAVNGDRFSSVRQMAPHWWWVEYPD